MRKALIFLVLIILAPKIHAQNSGEMRFADTRYRYMDISHTFGNKIVADLFYIGVPGSNEFNFGLGYAWQPKAGLTLEPVIYAAQTKEQNQRSLKIALQANYERKGWKINCFLAHNVPLRKNAAPYQVLDTLDVTRVLKKPWEFGVSSGIFHQAGRWNPQVGPIAKLNDSRGAWAVSYRLGPQKEFRIGRTFNF